MINNTCHSSMYVLTYFKQAKNYVGGGGGGSSAQSFYGDPFV